MARPFRIRGVLSRSEIVTGERLLALAEVAIVPRHVFEFHRHLKHYARQIVLFDDYGELDERTFAQISAARSIFVYTHELPGFREWIWPRLDGSGYVLITHNSDHEVNESHLRWIDAAGEKLAAWFAQNVTVEHPKLTPLPIGIANSMWDHGNLRTLHRWMRRSAGRTKPQVLYARFNPVTHPSRERAQQVLGAAFPGIADAPDEQQSFARYLAELSSHRFCVCPRGNGIDTHRFWECQYLGVVPVVEHSVHSEHWRSCGLPMVILDDWNDLSPDLLRKAGFALQPEPAEHRHLRLSHYDRLVRGAIAAAPDRRPPTRPI